METISIPAAQPLAAIPTASVCEVGLRCGAIDERVRRAYRDDGVVIVRGAFDAGAYAGIVRDLSARLALLERHHGIVAEAGGSGDFLSAIGRRVIALEEAVPGTQSILYDAMSRAPAMHAIAADARVVDLVGNFVAPPVAHHDRFILLMSLPRETWHLAGWHQDWYYNEGPESTLTLYAPLQKTDETNGMLLFALGAHRGGLLPHGENPGPFPTKWHIIGEDRVEGFERIAAPVLEPGDIALFDSMVPHSARVNTSETIRFVLNFRYHGLDDPAFVAEGWRPARAGHARAALARQTREDL
jgi:ectoine hydroxylase-related dioxygenase (phytanoyl-CoA dioxygenase family)